MNNIAQEALTKKYQVDFVKIPRALRHHPDVNNNKDMMLALIEQNIACFEYASETLKNDFDVALLAATTHENYIHWCGEDILNNKDFILTLLNSPSLNKPEIRTPHIICISENLRDDIDVAISFVSRNGMFLKNVSQRLQAQPSVVLAALKNDNGIFSCIDNLLSEDTAFFKIASEETQVSLKYFSQAVIEDKECVLSAIKHNWYEYKYASYTLQRDLEVAYAALESKKLAYQIFPYDLKKMIGDNDPMEYLSKAIMEKKLQNDLDHKKSTTSLKAKL